MDVKLPTALWTRDGLRFRSLYSAGVAAASGMPASPGQIQDLTSWVFSGKEQVVHDDPARIIMYFNLGSLGMFQGVA